MLQQTLITKYYDKGWNVLGIIFEHEADNINIVQAMRDAAAEYAATEDGKSIVASLHGDFNYGDFVENVPDEICRNHGFSIVDTFATDLIVDHDDKLIEEDWT